jgi:hypothetical protein
VTAKLALLKRIAALEAAPTHAKPLRIVGGLPDFASPPQTFLIGRHAVSGGLPALPGTNIIMPFSPAVLQPPQWQRR